MSDEILNHRARSIKPQGYASTTDATPPAINHKEVRKKASNFWKKRGLKEPKGFWI